ncbi:glycine--tRNA ligase subunit beta [Polyangium aurulentum]|uniref:glycine--tRNA ligase subunit beta n=1 Tax=Polyangium aurulentum TaxID=2567896 RepID=UPI0010AEBC3B|nr:glycine--tRNA ligase subunit beta [Polyangium aurulentum]UQA62003.1 glycine--tRNA ligase subunit beta [Polyangium aurulentum]
MSQTRDLLLEIGCEELPASFVDAALRALPDLAKKRFSDLRLAHGEMIALGTPRRLSLVIKGLAERQPDLEEEVTGPPVRAAFKDGAPTKAAEAFATKLGCSIADLRRVETPKGEYLVGTRRETGGAADALLPEALVAIASAIPFRKSMRWGTGEFAFGRPIQWIVALFGDRVIDLELAGIKSGKTSYGHRFLAPGAVEIAAAGEYVDVMRKAHVLVDPEERARVMRERLLAAAKEAGGTLIEDEFLIGENLSLVEEPHVIVGGYGNEFLELPERVILEVAKGHQRYFGVRGSDGRLLPKYLSVVNTALHPENIRRGNDSVMRARLSDARFFYTEDLKVPLAERRQKLAGIVFQKRLGTVLGKAERIERLARELGLLLQLPEATIMAAASGAHLAKCDLVTLMVGEFPELEGEMGRAYALAQGVSPDVANVIREHYQPKGAHEATPKSDAGALVSIADRLDTLVGCFAIGLSPTGATDPYGLRRACLGVLRTLLDRGFDLRISDAFRAAYDGYASVKLDLGPAELSDKLGDFFNERLRGLLAGELPGDVVAAALGVAAERPIDVRARALAIAQLDAATRASVGEVFKRATNIASGAPIGEPTPPRVEDHASEIKLYEGYISLREKLAALRRESDYGAALREVAAFAPLLHQYFVDVYVMTDDVAVRENRLRLMRAIAETCATLAKLELLGERKDA